MLKERLVIALDVDTKKKALRLVQKLKTDVRLFKVGLELFTSCGPNIVDAIREEGCGVFLDLKFHDIPNTVGKAASSITKLRPFMFNVHALGGYEMMAKTAVATSEEARRLGIERPKVLAVTILTSMDKEALKKIGLDGGIEEEVLRLARLAKSAGLDGVVVSPQETKAVRDMLGEDFLIVTPGVRPAGSDRGDQKRVATPKEAIANGADMIVVGRPVTEAKDPNAAARKILQELT